MNEPTPLPARLEATRQVLLLSNRIGVHGTNAIIEAGLGELSSNTAIAVLTQLAAKGPMRPRNLLGVTRLTRGGLSNLFDRLENAGFIARTYGTVPGDRRGATITITEKGSAAVSMIDDLVTKTLETLETVLIELNAALDLIDTEPASQPSGRTTRSSVSDAGLWSVAGAAATKALADADPNDPTPSATAVVLCCAAQEGHTRPRELMKETGLSSSGVSQLLDRLENAGLVRRRSGRPPDRRAVIVALTDEGCRQLERRLTAVADHIALLRSAVSHQDG